MFVESIVYPVIKNFKYNNSPWSVTTKWQCTELAYSMFLCLTYVTTYWSNSLTATYSTIHEEWQVIMPPVTLQQLRTVWALSGVLWLGLSAVIRLLQLHNSPVLISITWPLLKWLYQFRIFHKRNSSSYKVQGVSRIIYICPNSTAGVLLSFSSNYSDCSMDLLPHTGLNNSVSPHIQRIPLCADIYQGKKWRFRRHQQPRHALFNCE